MNNPIEEFMEECKVRAGMVLGRHSWDRDMNDPVVKKTVDTALENVRTFLEGAENKRSLKMLEPHPAMTADPEPILTLRGSAPKLLSVSVSFYGNNECIIGWSERDGSYHKSDKLTVTQVLEMDVLGKLEQLGRQPQVRGKRWDI